jgi:hypothetical protein
MLTKSILCGSTTLFFRVDRRDAPYKDISSSTLRSQNHLIMEFRDVETGVPDLIIGLEISEYRKLILFLRIRYTVGSILSEIGLKVLGAAHNLL